MKKMCLDGVCVREDGKISRKMFVCDDRQHKNNQFVPFLAGMAGAYILDKIFRR